ncbi:hypothetical protein [Sphingomonas sp.]|uniref:hypothetical protein n=1 Tax=Sphingomonas sp. TaxID=28214 RepID=UPI002ED7EFFF
MRSRLLRVLTIAAMLFASFSMLGGHAAMAAPGASIAAGHGATGHGAMAADGTAAMAGHCDDAQKRSGDRLPGADIDCMIACAALPALGGCYVFERPSPSSAQRAPRVAGIHGVDLQADPPPPRRS